MQFSASLLMGLLYLFFYKWMCINKAQFFFIFKNLKKIKALLLQQKTACFRTVVLNIRVRVWTDAEEANVFLLECLRANILKNKYNLNLCIQVNIVLQNSHFDCGDITTAQNIKNSPLESASEMSDEENIFNT